MVTIFACDECGREATKDNQGYVLCAYHHAQYDLASLKEDYEKQKEWTERIWISKLDSMLREIERLEKIIADERPNYEND